MKTVLLFLTFAFCFPAFSQNFELHNGDTINKIDVNRKRQGHWRVKAKSPKNHGYANGTLLEEGKFVNSRKEGLWKKYFPDGSLKSEVTYKGSRATGPYTLYYNNGQIEEQGNWVRSKNTGGFKRFHENGNVAQDFTFTESGKRTGEQKYFHENGKLRLVGTWNEGVETGEMKEYYESGDLMSVRQFNNGTMDKSSYESYAPKTPQEDPIKTISKAGEDINATAKKEEKPNQGVFDGNGYKKLYNKNKLIAKDGTFKRYRLIDGKQYKYDDNGLLLQIMIFKDGKYIGDGVIEENQ